MASSPLLCGNCGTYNVPSESFCDSCGYALIGATIVATVSATPTGQLPARMMLRQRYRVLHIVGQGGMGAVYMAQDTQLGDRLVAVKEMSQGNLYGQQAQNAIESFKGEAHLLAGLQHPNLPGIHDYFAEVGRWYLVMSFIEGETLADYLVHRKLALEETVHIGLALCNVLGYLHAHKPPIIFRDLKPSNIMRNADGHMYLIDFGIARHFKPGQAKDTASYGSMGYAPLEQYGRAQTTERSDIYSLGVTLYECISGYDPAQSPFRFPPLQSLVPQLPDRFTNLITQMLEMDESKRPANIKLVEQELQQISVSNTTTPKQQVAPPVPFVPTQYAPPPAPTPFVPTQYAMPAPVAPIPYIPPPPASYTPTPARQIYVQPAPMANMTPVPARPSLLRKTLTVIGKVLSIIGMIIGGLFVFVGIVGILTTFSEPLQIFANLAIGGLVLFFGTLIFFIARIRKNRLPISKAKKNEAIVGNVIGIVAFLFAIGTIVAATMHPMQDYGDHTDLSSIIAYNVFTIIFGALIWWITRIRIKKKP